jgi:hypothetical protein
MTALVKTVLVVVSVAAGANGFVGNLPTWQTWSGEISDTMCGASHVGMGELGKSAKDCTATCVEAGGKYVFVSNGRVFGIENQNFKALAANAGSKVRLIGIMGKDGKNITTVWKITIDNK